MDHRIEKYYKKGNLGPQVSSGIIDKDPKAAFGVMLMKKKVAQGGALASF